LYSQSLWIKSFFFIYYVIAIYFLYLRKNIANKLARPVWPNLPFISSLTNQMWIWSHKPQRLKLHFCGYFKSCLWVYQVYTPTSLEVGGIYRHQNFVELYAMRHFLKKSMTIWKVSISGNTIPNELNTLSSLGQV